MTEQADKDAATKPQWWNLVSKVETEQAAVDLVKQGGFVGGYLAVSGIILMIVAWYFPDVVGAVPEDRIYSFLGFGVQVLLGAALGFLVWKTQSWWAVVPLFVWAIIEGAFKILAIFAGGGAAGSAIAVIIVIVAVQMLRGRILLSRIRKRNSASASVTPVS